MSTALFLSSLVIATALGLEFDSEMDELISTALPLFIIYDVINIRS